MKKPKLLQIIGIIAAIVLVVFLYLFYGLVSYTNQKDEFSIQYPSFFKHSTSRWPESDPFYQVEELWNEPTQNRVPGYTKEQIILDITSSEESKISQTGKSLPYQTKKIMVAGREVTEKIYKDRIILDSIEHKGKRYTFSYLPPTYPEENYHFPKHLDMFDSMLSSFKFIN
jgi:hypothetical protein